MAGDAPERADPVDAIRHAASVEAKRAERLRDAVSTLQVTRDALRSFGAEAALVVDGAVLRLECDLSALLAARLVTGRKPRRWTRPEVDFLLREAAAGRAYADIAAALDRSVDAVTARIRAQRIKESS